MLYIYLCTPKKSKMKKLSFILTIIAITFALSNCSQKQDEKMSNIFFQQWDTPFEVPPFEKIKPEDYAPAFREAMNQQNKTIKEITSNKEEPDFENTIASLAYSGRALDKVSSVFFGQLGANTNDELQKIAMEISPELSAHSDGITMNAELFDRIKTVYRKKEQLNLNNEQKYLLENTYQEFVNNGANLSKKDKEQLKKINGELSVLTLKFEQNVLNETNNYKLIINNKRDLSGLPESVIEEAASTAEKAGLKGKWVFTTQKPSMIPFLQFANNRDLRKELYTAYLNRGNNNNEYDNKDILKKIIDLRLQKAKLLGFDQYANYRLQTRMAKNSNNVYNLLDKVWDAALPVAKNERDEMQSLIYKEGDNFKLESWDWWYYAEKIRKQKYNLEEKELKPYFKLENVRNGAFDVFNKLYGVTFTEIENIPKPHADVLAYEVKEADGKHIGILYMDFFPRKSKQSGAWQGEYRTHFKCKKGEISPVVTVVYNFTKPGKTTPSLLNFDEVETLFHEMGHAMDALFAKNTYPSTHIPSDFVELPSQIMEHWATEPEVLKMYAKDYKTNKPIPDKLINKINNSKYFNQGFNNVEYLAASYLDMDYHTIKEPLKTGINEFEKNSMNKIGLIKEIEPRYHSTYFMHITGGYDAGYYSYLWAAVLDNDAYEYFKETGIFNKKTAAKFRKNILEKDGTQDPEKLYRDFRGRNAVVEPLLKNRGLK
jgi:peptidyl-dipeptidase Dcp